MPPPLTQAKPAFLSRCAALATDYFVYVQTPDPLREPGPWPAVILLDGDYAFDRAVEGYRQLREERLVRPAVIVGVGYGRGFGEPGNYRGRDYTPTAAAEEPGSGGADAFLDHLTGALWPELARRYPVQIGGSVLSGYSLSSLAVLRALFQPRPFFPAHLAGAPSLWWDGRSILRLAAECRDRQAELPARLFLGVGSGDSESMRDDLVRFERQLAERPFSGLRTTSVTLPGWDHYTAAPGVIRAGLRELLGG